jgi:hypothetical protein
MAVKLDWKAIVGTVAPTLATALGGPLAGVAVKSIAGKLLDRPQATEEEVQQAVLGADPQTLVRLKELDIEFKKFTTDAGIRLEQIDADDRANARARETQVRDHTPAYLAYAITVGFFGTLAFMLINGKPATGGDALLVMLGSLGTAWAGVVAYYFGSSAGSRKKDEAISQMARG